MKKVVFLFLGVLVGVAVMVATMNEGCNADVCYGRVLDSTGKPLKDVAVHGVYISSESPIDFEAITDVDGYYQDVRSEGFFFTEVFNKLQVDVIKNGYVDLDNNNGFECEMGLAFIDPVQVTLRALDIVLTKGGGFDNFDVVVKDSLTEELLRECKVRAKKPVGYALVNYTNGSGTCQMENLLYGTYTVTVTKTGYRKQSVQKVNVPYAGTVTVALVSN